MMRDDVIIDDFWTLYEQVNEAKRKEGDPKNGNPQTEDGTAGDI